MHHASDLTIHFSIETIKQSRLILGSSNAGIGFVETCSQEERRFCTEAGVPFWTCRHGSVVPTGGSSAYRCASLSSINRAQCVCLCLLLRYFCVTLVMLACMQCHWTVSLPVVF